MRFSFETQVPTAICWTILESTVRQMLLVGNLHYIIKKYVDFLVCYIFLKIVPN